MSNTNISSDNREKGKDRAVLNWILKTIRPELPIIIGIIIGEAVWAVFGTVTALFSKEIVNSAVDGNKDKLLNYIIIYLIVALSLILFHAAVQYLNERCKARIEILFRNRIFGGMLGKSYSGIKQHHTGELVNRLTGDVSVISEAATTIVPQVVMMTVRLAFAMGVLIYMRWQFAIFFAAGGAIILICSKLVKKKIQFYHREMQQANGKMRSFWQEIFENLMVIKAFACEENSVTKSDTLMYDHYKLRMSRAKFSTFSMLGVRFMVRLGHIFAIGYGALCLYGGTMDYGTLTALTQLVSQVQQPFAQMSGIMPRYYAALTSAERLMEIEALTDDSTANESENCGKLYEEMASIDFENVYFEYDKDNPVLEGANVHIEKGDFVSVVGMSGIRKSTMFKVLLDVYPKLSGTADVVKTDGEKVPLTGKTRKLFAYVPQGNMLFSGSIKENLLFMTGDRTVTDEEITKALNVAEAAEFVKELPDGLDSVIGENGIGLSEGQIQRISVARAILSGAPILLLDEATSALDEKTEAAVLENLKNLQNRTLIIVTHKKAALAICNKTLRIKDRKIIEE